MISTIDMRGIWKIQWRFARLLTRKWWSVGNDSLSPMPAIRSARLQAPFAFKCLVARQRFRDIHGKEQKDQNFMLWKGESGPWFYVRPDKHNRHSWP